MLALLLTSLVLTGSAEIAIGGNSRQVQVDVIGDSLSTGIDTPGDTWTSDAQHLLLTHGLHVQVVNAAENGAGYAAVGQHGNTFNDLVGQVVNARSRVIVLFGSDNDVGQPHLAAAITECLDHVKAVAPLAKLFVVGPPAPPADTPQQLQGIRDALQAATVRAGGQFVDPLALKWFQGPESSYVNSDGEHPNAAGELYLAREMTTIVTPAIARLLPAGAR